MPYGFYVLVRFVAAGAFAFFSYEYFRAKREGLGIIFASLAVLFQPFIKIALGRAIWNILDVIIAVALVYLIFKSHKK